MPAHIYQRPVLIQGNWLSTAIYVRGVLPNYELNDSYEGRLQIINSVGPHFVRQIAGDRLPDGSSIYVDENTNEVVVTWPYLQIIPGRTDRFVATLANNDFESSKGWKYGEGWSVTDKNPISGKRSAAYHNQNGMSVMRHLSRFQVNPGKEIVAQCRVRQGASAEGNAGASVMLEWRNEEGEIISTSEGNRVMSASKNNVYPSTVKAVPPDGTATVNIACNGIRYRENKEVWVDNFTWDHVVLNVIEPVVPSDEYRLTIEVTDSLGRVATWSGSIFDESVFFTSRPYAVTMEEGFSTELSAAVSETRLTFPPELADAIATSQPSVFTASLRDLLQNYVIDPDAYQSPIASIVSTSLKETLMQFTIDPDAYTQATPASVVSASIKEILITTTIPPEAYTSENASVIGATLS